MEEKEDMSDKKKAALKDFLDKSKTKSKPKPKPKPKPEPEVVKINTEDGKIKKHFVAIWKTIFESNGSNYKKTVEAIESAMGKEKSIPIPKEWVPKEFPVPKKFKIVFEKTETYLILKAYEKSEAHYTHLTISRNEKDPGMHFTTLRELHQSVPYKGGLLTRKAKGLKYRKLADRPLTQRRRPF